MRKFGGILVLLLCFGLVNARSSADSTDANLMDPVIARLDSMSQTLFKREKFFVNEQLLQASINTPVDQLPKFTDDQIMEKMRLIPSGVPLNFNKTVKGFIEFFAYRRRGFTAIVLANSQIYFPIFEEILDKKGLPLELKYLPVVESALNPVAVSPAGATGLWQLMYGTGAQMGLNINSYIDERRDPVKATEAAANYLKMLYDMYGDWQLVLAAYNSGPGTVNRAIARAGGIKNFWAIQPYLPAETRSYVPTYIAALYVMHYYRDFQLVSAEPRRELYAIDTVMITGKVGLKHICDVLGIAQDELQYLNPGIKTGIVPLLQDGYAMNLPVKYFGAFEMHKAEIMMDTSMLVQNYEPPVASVARTVWHKVKSKETLAMVAARYGVSASSIRKWNYLKNPYIYPGLRLKIIIPAVNTQPPASYTQAFVVKPIDKNKPVLQDTVTEEINEPETGDAPSNDSIVDTLQRSEVKKTVAPTPLTVKPGDKLDQQCGCIYHVVQPGDTLWNIAQRYEGISVEKLRADNKVSADHPIKVGDVVKIIK